MDIESHTGAAVDVEDNSEMATVTQSRNVTLHTRTLRSLKVVEVLVSGGILPRKLSVTVFVYLGITHWAVEIDKEVLEVRADSGKGPVLQIRHGHRDSPEYNTKSVRRYHIGTTTKTDEEIDFISSWRMTSLLSRC
jgi:hypothetical protein